MAYGDLINQTNKKTMAMQFEKKTEKEIQEASLWPAGIYDFETTKAEPAFGGPNSKNPGMEYIAVEHRIFNSEGASRIIRGSLHPKMEAQLRHFCVVGNLMEKYEAGTLEATDCVGVTGKLKLKVKEASGNFPAKNEVQDFVVEKKEVDGSDDAPF
jgi:hypothetical protein